MLKFQDFGMFQYTMIAFEVYFIIQSFIQSSILKYFLIWLSKLNVCERKNIQKFGLFSWFEISSQNNSNEKSIIEETKYLDITLLYMIT